MSSTRFRPLSMSVSSSKVMNSVVFQKCFHLFDVILKQLEKLTNLIALRTYSRDSIAKGRVCTLCTWDKGVDGERNNFSHYLQHFHLKAICGLRAFWEQTNTMHTKNLHVKDDLMNTKTTKHLRINFPECLDSVFLYYVPYALCKYESRASKGWFVRFHSGKQKFSRCT